MKSRPILFSAPMVLALRDDSKTQTRRIAKLTTSLPNGKGWTCLQKPGTNTVIPLIDGQWQWSPAAGDDYRPYPNIAEYCPYGVPGDQLWTRESFSCFGSSDSITPPVPRQCQIRYLADRDTGKSAVWVPMPADAKEPKPSLKGKPSIHMPRWASRDTLALTRVWVERVQDISEEDAMAEGVKPIDGWYDSAGGMVVCSTRAAIDFNVDTSKSPRDHRGAYAILWDEINGPGSWNANPWVWALEFKRL